MSQTQSLLKNHPELRKSVPAQTKYFVTCFNVGMELTADDYSTLGYHLYTLPEYKTYRATEALYRRALLNNKDTEMYRTVAANLVQCEIEVYDAIKAWYEKRKK